MTTLTADERSLEPRSAGGFTHRQVLVILSGLMLGMLLAALDQTIVSTSIRTIADDLHGYSMQAWVTTAYLITSTLSTPLYGKLSDMFGRKPFYLAAITIFVVGSLACSFADSMYQLAAFRALQGLGAGGLMSLALTIMGDIVGPGNAPATRATSWPSSAPPASSGPCWAACWPDSHTSWASPAGAGCSW